MRLKQAAAPSPTDRGRPPDPGARGVVSNVMRRYVTTLLTLAAVIAPTAIAAESTAPSLTLVRRAPVTVSGAHFKRFERVRLTASTAQNSAVTKVRTTGRGRLLATFTGYNPNPCLRLVIKAVGSKGDRAKLIIEPQPIEIPCGI
jgi:hypothetical protein